MQDQTGTQDTTTPPPGPIAGLRRYHSPSTRAIISGIQQGASVYLHPLHPYATLQQFRLTLMFLLRNKLPRSVNPKILYQSVLDICKCYEEQLCCLRNAVASKVLAKHFAYYLLEYFRNTYAPGHNNHARLITYAAKSDIYLGNETKVALKESENIPKEQWKFPSIFTKPGIKENGTFYTLNNHQRPNTYFFRVAVSNETQQENATVLSNVQQHSITAQGVIVNFHRS